MTPYHAWHRSAVRDGAYDASFEQDRPDQLIDGLIAGLVDVISIGAFAQFPLALQQETRALAERDTARLKAEFSAALLELREQVTNCVAGVLEPLVDEKFVQAAIEEFADTLKQMLPEFGHSFASAEAPLELIERLQLALTARGITAEFEAVGNGEITVRGGQASLSTRLQDWASRLKGSGQNVR
jgi:hypothetical protein